MRSPEGMEPSDGALSGCTPETVSSASEDRAHALLADIDASARRSVHGNGEGHAVWREWGAGPPLVLLHGGAGSWRHFARQIEHFSREWRVIAADMPGFGDAADSDPQMEPDAMADVLAHGLDTLVGDASLHLVGFSYGGIIGGYLARRIGPRIHGFVIAGGVGFEAPRSAVELTRWRHLDDDDARRDAHRANLAALMIADPGNIDEMAVLIQEANAGMARHNTRPTARRLPLTGVLDESDVPLAAIWGERDQIAARHFEERRKWLAGLDPDARFVLIPEAGHWVQYEAPDAFNQSLADCLSEFRGQRRRGGQHAR